MSHSYDVSRQNNNYHKKKKKKKKKNGGQYDVSYDEVRSIGLEHQQYQGIMTEDDDDDDDEPVLHYDFTPEIASMKSSSLRNSKRRNHDGVMRESFEVDGGNDNDMEGKFTEERGNIGNMERVRSRDKARRDYPDSNTGTALFTTAQNEVRIFFLDPGRSMKRLRHKISLKMRRDASETVTRDSYHYASVVVSDANLRKDPLSIYDEIDEDYDHKLGFHDTEEVYDNAVGDERMDLYRLSSLAFTSMALLCSSSLSAIPPLILVFGIVKNIIDRWYVIFPFAMVRFIDNATMIYGSFHMSNLMSAGPFKAVFPVVCISILELILYSHFLPMIYAGVKSNFFNQPDGTVTVEWKSYQLYFKLSVIFGYLLVILRGIVVIAGIIVIVAKKWKQTNRKITVSPSITKKLIGIKGSWYYFDLQIYILYVMSFLSILAFGAGFFSMHTYILSSSSSGERGQRCDILDETECILPFPSSYFLEVDESTETGYRVNLSDALFDLRGSRKIDDDYWSTLDGFSTLGPLLFYIEGLKEGGGVGLQGPDRIAHSVTAKSVTLLLDVDRKVLVHHFAEIDFLDNERPLVIVQPAKPLSRNSHYALMVHNARGVDGEILPPTPGFKALMADNFTDDDQLSQRASHFRDELLPTFQEAASWLDLMSQNVIQLLFDFHTASAESQLGNARGIRDSVLATIRSPQWEEDMTVTKVIDHNCQRHNLGRTIYVDFNVPWYMKDYGDGHRGEIIDTKRISSNNPELKPRRAKFTVHVPCSVKANAISGGGRQIQAVVEYGHGLFSTHEEAEESRFLHRMADDHGYIIVAMDWRGMSRYDLPIILQMLITDPSKVESVRDNILQGYANKMAMMELVNTKKLFQLDELSFDGHRINFLNGNDPTSIFYGISQGGILGAGYVSLSNSADIIDRSILGVPGAPFSFILSRSDDFLVYNQLMLYNFRNNRHIRIYLSLVQMAYDSVDASGYLAEPLDADDLPRVLLQAGIGDSQVTTISAEILARAFNASLLEDAPKEVFGLEDFMYRSDEDGPKSALVELLYVDEASTIPKSNISPDRNNVHICVRYDLALRNQVIEFINDGRISNPCTGEKCVRQRARSCDAARRRSRHLNIHQMLQSLK